MKTNDTQLYKSGDMNCWQINDNVSLSEHTIIIYYSVCLSVYVTTFDIFEY